MCILLFSISSNLLDTCLAFQLVRSLDCSMTDTDPLKPKEPLTHKMSIHPQQ